MPISSVSAASSSAGQSEITKPATNQVGATPYRDDGPEALQRRRIGLDTDPSLQGAHQPSQSERRCVRLYGEVQFSDGTVGNLNPAYKARPSHVRTDDPEWNEIKTAIARNKKRSVRDLKKEERADEIAAAAKEAGGPLIGVGRVTPHHLVPDAEDQPASGTRFEGFKNLLPRRWRSG